jgi:hypothetical protein
MLGDEERLVFVTGGSEAYAKKARPLVVVSMLDPFEPELVLKEILQAVSEASGGQRFSPCIIDPGTVIGVEPDILIFISIGVVELMGSPDIHRR